MKRVIWHLLGRYYEARSERAFKDYVFLRDKAWKFFSKIGGPKL